MKSLILCICIGLFMVSAKNLSDFGINDTHSEYLFSSYMSNHNRQYEVSEVQMRFDLFKEALRFILEHNSSDDAKDFTLAVNQFADRTDAEKAALHTSTPSKYPDPFALKHEGKAYGDVEVDWRRKGIVQSIRNQGQCGSGYAFSAIAALEVSLLKVRSRFVRMSEQHIIDCSSGDNGNSGCSGGQMSNVMSFTSKYGVRNGNQYVYNGMTNACAADSYQAITCNYSYFSVPNDAGSLLKAVQRTAVAVAINSNCSYFLYYSSGILTKSCGNATNNGMAVIGAVTEGGKKAWIVRPAWSEAFGRDGYIYIARDENICGMEINYDNVYPNSQI